MFRIKYHGKGIFDFTGENIITKILQNELYQANYKFAKTSISRTKKETNLGKILRCILKK
ncbi:hypothetical protein COL26_15890 [Bacillus thuringiensis]|uniref:Uncharacterized protein n=1 Tax=Bacillus thuringiensis TaxID=1428 RepID=A0ABD6S898_BACTU|nr:hypothetical protein bthur0013_46550 [Bacillus thuringiensis IBL 200]OTZ40399.1 hypothetical protein BK762_34750 [Bacillus thuringiensis serovar toumanoffi]PER56397.1 hypothetical protein CN495_06310 [Bacillus thuringiensis]PEU93117.1 hypothetical protein CN411_06395 [Bacillus thuringiensis]PFF37629.1 hypothetical protein CN335_16380 [Bacillus thuringiensis]